MEEKYRKGKGNAGLDGVQFQINLSTVFLLNALNNLKGWRISTENQDAAKFDDISMELADGSAVLLQAKYKHSKKITKKQLLSTNSNNKDFSLPKYFFSYHEVKSKFTAPTVIVCTNTGIDERYLGDVISRTYVPPDSLLYYEGSRSSLFHFKENLITILKASAHIYLNKNLRGKGFHKSIITDDNLKDFLKNFQLICNYPSGTDISTVIGKSLPLLVSNVSSQEIYKKMEDWFRQRRGEYLTEGRAYAMFCEIRSEKYCETLRSYHVCFRRNNFSLSTTKQLIHVRTDGRNILQFLKIYHALTNDQNERLFVNPNDNIEVQKQTTDAFGLPKYTLLIMSWPMVRDESIMTEICYKLRNTLQKYDYKKIILLSNDLNQTQLGYSALVVDGSVTFDDLTDKTQKLIKTKNVIFQGETLSLEKLFPCSENAKAISSVLLEPLVKGDTIKLGSKLVGLCEDKARYYIDRTFEREFKEKSDVMENVKKIKESLTEKEIFDVNEKVVLIADIAGMGKSTVLVKIATHIKENFRHLWVVRIELNACTKLLRDCLKNNRDTIQLTELLHAAELTSDPEKVVFSMKERVVVLLDGFDEICPDYTGLILKLVSQCREASNVAKVIVTTRPHMIQELTQIVETTPFTLQYFTKADQINFLTKYWTHNLKLAIDADKSKCQKFAETLIYRMSLWTSQHGEHQFSAIPLQVRMLAEIFQESVVRDDSLSWQGCSEFLMTDGSEPTLPEHVNVTILYEMFVEKKRDVFIEKGNPTGNTASNRPLWNLFEECLSYHRSVAIEVVFGESKYNLTSCYSDPSKETDVLKIGIIHKWDNELHFIHRTFAEYFAAEFLILELQNNSSAQFLRFFFDSFLLVRKFNVVRTFLEHFLHRAQDALTYTNFYQFTSATDKVSLNYLSNSMSNLLFLPILEGRIFLLQFIFKCIDFKVTRNNEVNIVDFHRSYINKCKFWKYFKTRYKNGNTLKFLHGLTRRAGINVKDGFGRTPLHYAARKGNFGMVKFLLEQGANVNSSTKQGCTALHLHKGRLEIVKLLVRWGANINLKKDDGEALIHLAVRSNWLDILRFLLQQGVDVDMKNDNGDTSLHLAADSGNFALVKFFVENGAIVNIQNSTGSSPIHLAVAERNIDIVKLLVESGSELDVRNADCNTPMHLAAHTGDFEIVQIFMENGAKVDIQNSDGNTPMHLAAEAFHFRLLKFLVGNGTGLNIQSDNGNTLMHLAVEMGHLDIVKLLVAREADVNVNNNQGWLPIHRAVHMGQIEVVKFLLEQGVELNSTNPHGNSLLHDFAEKGQLEMVQLLIKLEAKVDLKNTNGNTALHLACRGSKLECVEFLLQWGADPNTRNNDGIVPIYLAIQRQNSNIIRTLFDYGADLNKTCFDFDFQEEIDINCENTFSWSPIHLATAKMDLNTVTLLVNLGAHIDIKDTYGNTALHIAARLSCADIVRYLVGNGADVMSVNKFGLTPIHLAARKTKFNLVKLFIELGADINSRVKGCGRILHMFAANGELNTVKCLIDVGANVDIPDENGNTALHLAAKAGHFSTVKLLVEQRADINFRNGKGSTPIHIAAENGATEIVNFFVMQGADVNIRNSDGKTALHLCSSRRKLNLVTICFPCKRKSRSICWED